MVVVHHQRPVDPYDLDSLHGLQAIKRLASFLRCDPGVKSFGQSFLDRAPLYLSLDPHSKEISLVRCNKKERLAYYSATVHVREHFLVKRAEHYFCSVG